MSAYICNPEHIGLLAAYATQSGAVIRAWDVGNDRGNIAARVAVGLLKENIRSVKHRYGCNDLPGPRMNLGDQYLAVAAYARDYIKKPGKHPSPVTICKLANGLAYQSCETDDWENTHAYRQVDLIINNAVRSLPGYEEAPWEWQESNPLKTVEALYERT